MAAPPVAALPLASCGCQASFETVPRPVKTVAAASATPCAKGCAPPCRSTLPTATFASTRPHLQDFPRVSNQPFAAFGSETPWLRDLARVLRCGLPPLVLQAIPARAMSCLRRVNCCLPLCFCKALPAKPCQAFCKGVGGTRALAHLYNN